MSFKNIASGTLILIISSILICFAFFAGCDDDDDDSSASTPTPTPMATATPTPVSGDGQVIFTLSDGTIYRIPAVEGATAENMTERLDVLAPGSDEWGSLSPDGQWLLLSTDRFEDDCVGWECLGLVKADMTAGEAINAPSGHIRAEGFSAVASGGNAIVFPAMDGPHEQDIWLTQRQGDGWSEPQLLTGNSPYTWHVQPAISADGSKVCFNCGPEAYSIPGTGICEVSLDGSGFRTVIMPADGPAGSDANALHHPDYAPDGGIVFEADWNGEQIWRLPPGSSTPLNVSGSINNDNSPCVLPNGSIASLWLDRPGGPGYHELKLMTADGQDWFMLLHDVDIADIGIACGN